MAGTGGALSAVSKRYSHRGRRVLDEINLVLAPGSGTGLTGGNGSGKSTLVRIVAGVSRPTSGTAELPPKIGYVPERLADRINFTGYEYVTHMGRIRGLDSQTVDTRARMLFERLDLQPGAGMMFGSLSKGNRQKVIVAQAFLEPVDLLVLDEPVSGLDGRAVEVLGDLIHEAKSGGSAILVSGHDPSGHLGMDRVVRLENGLLIDTPVPPTATPVPGDRLIRLTATPGAHPGQVISMLPGVRWARVDASGLTLSLVAERLHADSVLRQSIHLGWSVNLVGDVQDGDWRP